MMSLSRTTQVAVLVAFVLAGTASVATATCVYRYTDKKPSYRVVIDASAHQVHWAEFVADDHAVKCGKPGSSTVGGFTLENAKITDGRFKAETVNTGDELDPVIRVLKISGRRKGKTIRGAVSLHEYPTAPGNTGWECWTGNGKGDSWVPYVARLRGVSPRR
jgi:hypothetical protein